MSDPTNAQSDAISQSERIDLESRLITTLLRGPAVARNHLATKMRVPEAFTIIPNVWRLALQSIDDGHPYDSHTLAQLPEVTELERGILDGVEVDVPIGTIEEVELLTKGILNTYWKNKLLNEINSPISDMTAGALDYNDGLSKLSDVIEALAAQSANKESIGIGKGYDVAKVIEAVTADSVGDIIPTGFPNYDQKAGGHALGEQIILSCPTSGGKTTLMLQKILNMCLGMSNFEYINQPQSALVMSLEMSEAEMWKRIFSNLTGIDIRKFRQPNELLDENDRILIADVAEKMSAYLAHYGHKLTLKGASETSIDDLRAELAIHPYSVVAIDYLNLMCESDQLWSEMGSIARNLKVLAQKRGFVCITAAQLDEDSLKIRYSRMIKEHCDSLWIWQPNAEAAQGEEVNSAFTQIFVDKGRNTGKFDFWLNFNFLNMRVTSVNPTQELKMYEVSSSTSSLPPKGNVGGLPPTAPPALTHQPSADPELQAGLNTLVGMNTSTDAILAEEPDPSAVAADGAASLPGALNPDMYADSYSSTETSKDVAVDDSGTVVSAHEVDSDDDEILL